MAPPMTQKLICARCKSYLNPVLGGATECNGAKMVTPLSNSDCWGFQRFPWGKETFVLFPQRKHQTPQWSFSNLYQLFCQQRFENLSVRFFSPTQKIGSGRTGFCWPHLPSRSVPPLSLYSPQCLPSIENLHSCPTVWFTFGHSCGILHLASHVLIMCWQYHVLIMSQYHVLIMCWQNT